MRIKDLMEAKSGRSSMYGDMLRDMGAEYGTDFTRLMGGLNQLLSSGDLSPGDRKAVQRVLDGMGRVEKAASDLRKMREYRAVIDILDSHYN